MYNLRFRQIHMDFHTSECIGGIGEEFDKKEWQQTLRDAAVNSVTCFATCHHGWSYYDSKLNPMHPNLKFDLLRAQFDACKEVDINVPIYLTAGVGNKYSYDHPEWREVGPDGKYCGWAPNNLTPGFHTLCFNTPYLDFLCSQITEVVRLFPDCDGIFLDIIAQNQCCCRWCLDSMHEKGLDPLLESDRKEHAKDVLMKYYKHTTKAAKIDNPDMSIFHNSGNIQPGETEKLKYFSHLELESLPTGGWGYDHFPLSAKYCEKLPFDVMGMTGKFHTSWGEFGGYKHPNALLYECAAMVSVGAKCSVGDQLHPCGRIDSSTYGLIGKAYRDIAEKEPWCVNSTSAAEIAVLSSSALNHLDREENPSDIGFSRIMLEGQLQFDVLDEDMSLDGYKLVVLPDDIPVDAALKEKLDTFIAAGGKLLLTGKSGIDPESGKFLFDTGADYLGESEFTLDYVRPIEDVAPSFCSSPIVMYLPANRIKVRDGKSLGQTFNPYFNRTYKHFCSHQHTPYKTQPSGFDCGSMKGNVLYLSHPVFNIYAAYGAVSYREYITKAIRVLLGEDMSLRSNLPSTARAHLREQPCENRYVLHLLYANTIKRGGAMELSGGNVSTRGNVEIIEDLLPLHDVRVSLKTTKPIRKAILQPQNIEIEITEQDGRTQLDIDRFVCHQMVELQY